MDCRQAAELMPWYLNGTLDAAERGDLEGHLERCDDCRGDLRETEAARLLYGGHPTAKQLLEYAADRPEAPRDLVEAHLANCSACADELAMALDSRRELDRQGAPEVGAEPGVPGRIVPLQRPPAPSNSWRAAAMAAALVGLIGIAGGLWSWNGLDRQRRESAERQRAAESRIAELEAELRGAATAQPNVPIHDLWPDGSVLRSAEGETARLEPRDGPAATLILNTQLDPGQQVERLEIRDAEDRLLESVSGVRAGPGGSFTMSVALSRLPRGGLRILLFGPDGAEPLETYTFELG